MSTAAGIAERKVAILVTVDVFGLSYLLGASEVSTVTGIARVTVGILATVDVSCWSLGIRVYGFRVVVFRVWVFRVVGL